jgi:hypothetical protein
MLRSSTSSRSSRWLPGHYFLDATLASAFVARWCAGYKVETAEGVFRVRTDEPTPRIGAAMHRTP